MKETVRIILLLILAVFYFLIPLDLIPDKLGRLGKLDDLAFLLIILWWSFFKPLYDEVKARVKNKNNSNSGQKQGTHDYRKSGNEFRSSTGWAYEILEVAPSDSLEQIKKAYHKKMQQYHPDLVANLGPELKDLAHQKTAQLNAAFEQIKKDLA